MKKSDIARAWKDESYRQTLNEEELNSLPANPAGELNETEMAAVNGGDVWPGFGGNGAAGAASSSSASNFQKRHIGSFSLICPIDVFSVKKVNVIVLVSDLLNIANCKEQICVRDDD